MKRTSHFVQPRGTVLVRPDGGEPFELPVVPGILKHLTVELLVELLPDPAVARKYTLEALRVAPWPALRHFPRPWLLALLPAARVTDARRRALEFMLRVRASKERPESP